MLRKKRIILSIYTAFFEDKDGKSIPTGLPILVLEKNGTLKWVTGIKVFSILDEIFH